MFVLVLHVLFYYDKSRGDELVEPIPVLGRENMSVDLSCLLPQADTPQSRVEWFDLVYNRSPEPIRIFDSRNNSNLQVNRVHPNRDNYQVGCRVAFYLR